MSQYSGLPKDDKISLISKTEYQVRKGMKKAKFGTEQAD